MASVDDGLCSRVASQHNLHARRRWLQQASLGVLAAGSGLLPALRSPARALAPPAGAALLTVSGNLRKPNFGSQASFDLAALTGLAQTTFTTRTPWFADERSFTGPLLRDLLAACGAQGDTLRMTALNDYHADMPVSDTQKHDVILAHLMDGKPMAVRDKGPLFVMYPFSSKPELRSTVYYIRAVWQLRAIEVL